MTRRCFALLALLTCGPAAAGQDPAFTGFGLMKPSDMQHMGADAQLAWANKQLGPFQKALAEAAARNRVPARLLAVVLLNELSDYGPEDILQEKAFSPTWTVGIGQTSVRKARERGHLKGLISEAEIAKEVEENRNFLARITGPDPDRLRDLATDYIAWRKLNDPPTGIEVAAREVSRLLDLLSQNPAGPWAKHFLKGPLNRQDPYANVKAAYYPPREDLYAAWEKKLDGEGKLPLHREISLTLAVVAAYNSESILTAAVDHQDVFRAPADGAKFFDARAHAVNAVELWAALLCQRKWEPSAPPPKKPGEKYYLEYYDLKPRLLKYGYKTEAEAQADAAKIKKFADEVTVSFIQGRGSHGIYGRGWRLDPNPQLDPGHADLLKAQAAWAKHGYQTRITAKPNWALWTLDMSGRIDMRHVDEGK